MRTQTPTQKGVGVTSEEQTSLVSLAFLEQEVSLLLAVSHPKSKWTARTP